MISSELWRHYEVNVGGQELVPITVKDKNISRLPIR